MSHCLHSKNLTNVLNDFWTPLRFNPKPSFFSLLFIIFLQECKKNKAIHILKTEFLQSYKPQYWNKIENEIKYKMILVTWTSNYNHSVGCHICTASFMSSMKSWQIAKTHTEKKTSAIRKKPTKKTIWLLFWAYYKCVRIIQSLQIEWLRRKTHEDWKFAFEEGSWYKLEAIMYRPIFMGILAFRAASPHFSIAARPWLWMWVSNSFFSSPRPSWIRDTRLYIRPKSEK